ncbi:MULTISPECIES: MFS transporter [unclassified Sporosarcina]|uniref:MFS transporter n=1 Tax=unclassified Sporosarcina TaxID=2647733 RepID=UPI00203A681D|nr:MULTISPECIES: MFS transporter [unclassified Sporosarcina]GKV65258.1 MFS transporter [Sporosarcina sp. NCCP-2331]GLB55382.1 MFS transporter [Sporosarcina sp. NCCP-2378]
MSNETLHEEDGRSGMPVKAVVAATFGTIIEWYDFFLYATAAALIFPKLFFPESDPYIATILSFTTLATGFLARPLGAIIFGHFGDRIGRKTALVITLWIIGISSTIIGLLPTYETIGIWAAIALVTMRIFQGIGVGGEWAGAVLLSMEWGSRKKRGFTASMPNAGVGGGMLLSSVVVALCMYFTGDNFYVWGWRIPFILSFVLLIAGVIIRSKITETPSFQRVTDGNQVAKAPVLEVLKLYPKQVLFVGMAKFSEHVPHAIFATYMITYVTGNFNIESSYMVNVIAVGSFLSIFGIPLFGHLADKFGIKRMYIMGIAVSFIWAFPYIGLIYTEIPILILLATIIFNMAHNIQAGAQPALVAQAFPAHLRYSGAALGTQVAAVFAGGIAPLVCTYLIHTTGTLYSIGAYIVISAMIGATGTILLKNLSSTADTIEKKEIEKSKGSISIM